MSHNATPKPTNGTGSVDAAKSLFIQAGAACNLQAWQQAEQLLNAHLRLRPGSVPGLSLMAMVLSQTGRFSQARDLWRELLQARPDHADGWSHLGYACESLRAWDEATASFEKALALVPHLHSARVGLALVAQKQGLHREALRALDVVLALQPQYADALFHSAISWQALGDVDKAVDLYRQALVVEPDHPLAASNRLMAMQYSQQWSLQARTEAARTWGQWMQAQVPSHRISLLPGQDTGRVLRIGLVSADLRAHPVGYFLHNALAAMDPATVHLTAYTNHVQSDDDWSTRLRAVVDQWHSVAYWSDGQLVQQVQRDAIDILVDLSGHTAGQRLAVFAAQPAPIQCSWIGYPATTGLTRMDYVLADPWSVPAGEAAEFTETVWHLPTTRQCYTPPADAPDVALRRTDGPLVLGCFQNLNKVRDGVLQAWSQILQQLPLAELRIQSFQLDLQQSRQAFEVRLAQAGIPIERVRLLGVLSRSDYWRALGDTDFLLDTFPYPGCTTTLEGLWMGVPTLTVGAPGLLGRQGESTLRILDLPDWIADSPDAYVQHALTWATRRPELAALRASLRPRLQASALCDAASFAWQLENAWRSMWRHACKGQPANLAAIDVRRLQPQDAFAYRTLMLRAYAEHPDAFTSSASERASLPPGWWTQRLAPDAHASEVIFGMFCNGALAGCCGLRRETREKTHHKSTLFGMVVEPAYRGRGFGRLLVQAVLDHAQCVPGLRLVQLTVTQGNAAAQTLYGRMGFTEFGVEPMAVAVATGFVAKVHMWHQLERPEAPSAA